MSSASSISRGNWPTILPLRAARHDEEGIVPVRKLRPPQARAATRSLTIPEKLGGLGATMLERIKAQERLAQGCGATALAINMHFNTVGLLIDLHRKFKAPNVEQKLRRIAAERLICGGSGSEPDNAIVALRPRTMARRADGGWLVNGRKIFGTQSVAMDLFFAEATWEEAPHGPTIITFFIPPRDTPGLVFKDDWNVMGMRATASRSSELKDAFVPDGGRGAARGKSQRADASRRCLPRRRSPSARHISESRWRRAISSSSSCAIVRAFRSSSR